MLTPGLKKFKWFRMFHGKLLLAFLLAPSFGYGFGKSQKIIGKGLEQPDIAAINLNFNKADNEDLNSVHTSSTETIHGYKYFKDPVDFITQTSTSSTILSLSVSTMTASSATITAATITSLTSTTGTITNIVSSSIGTNQIAYNNGTKLVGSFNMTYDGTTIASTGTYNFNGTWDGWMGANETWTYISSSQFSVPGDVTGKYQKGDKIKLTQTTAKYFSVTSVIAGVGVTTMTVTGGTDYTLANAAITSPFYSRQDSPFAFPEWFNWTPTFSASGSMTYSSTSSDFAKFAIKGKTVFITLRVSGTTGGTASTQIFFTLPVNPLSGSMEGQFAASAIDGGGVRIAAASTDTGVTGKVGIYRYDAANWGLGANRFIMVSGGYPF